MYRNRPSVEDSDHSSAILYGYIALLINASLFSPSKQRREILRDLKGKSDREKVSHLKASIEALGGLQSIVSQIVREQHGEDGGISGDVRAGSKTKEEALLRDYLSKLNELLETI